MYSPPTIYQNISKEIKTKIKAFRYYKSEIEEFPHPRSILAIESLSKKRGYESAFKNAETFELIRSVKK